MRLLAALVLLALPSAAMAAEEEAAPRRYGDRGTTHLGIALGLGSSGRGFAYTAGAEFGYFVLDGVAPGLDAHVTGGTGLLTTGLALATLRLVPIRTGGFSLFLVGRAGRVMIADHDDGYGVGGGAGLLLFGSSRVGLKIAYDLLRLTPASFCSDLAAGCTLHGLAVGVVAGL